MEQIVAALKGQISTRFAGLSTDENKFNDLATLAETTIVAGLCEYAATSSFQSVQNALGSADPLENSHIAHQMIAIYRRDIVRMGWLDERQSDRVAKFAIPFMLLLLSHKVNKNPSQLAHLLTEPLKKNDTSFFNFLAKLTMRVRPQVS